MELDDWELSTEDLDSLERDALKQIAHRNSSTTIPSHRQQQLQQQHHHSAPFNPQCEYPPPSSPIAESCPKNKVNFFKPYSALVSFQGSQVYGSYICSYTQCDFTLRVVSSVHISFMFIYSLFGLLTHLFTPTLVCKAGRCFTFCIQDITCINRT